MTVRFDGGSTAELNMNIQGRIWENIVAERESQQSRPSSRKKPSVTAAGRFYVRPLTTVKAEELIASGWKQRVAADVAKSMRLNVGDRFIYFVVESQAFFAVATITGSGRKPSKKDLAADSPGVRDSLLFPLDVDASFSNIDTGVTADMVEFESQANMASLLMIPNTFISVTEDEFELLAELLTEVTEDEEIEDEDEEEFEE